MTVAERVANESRIFIDVYTLATQTYKSSDPSYEGPTFKAKCAVASYRAWLVEEGYVDLDATE